MRVTHGSALLSLERLVCGLGTSICMCSPVCSTSSSDMLSLSSARPAQVFLYPWVDDELSARGSSVVYLYCTFACDGCIFHHVAFGNMDQPPRIVRSFIRICLTRLTRRSVSPDSDQDRLGVSAIYDLLLPSAFRKAGLRVLLSGN